RLRREYSEHRDGRGISGGRGGAAGADGASAGGGAAGVFETRKAAHGRGDWGMDVKPRIELNIGERGLTGFSAREGRQVGHAVERELARLMAQGPDFRGGSLDRVDAGRARVAPGRPQTTGARIAEAVYRSLTGGSR